jgi:CRP-like cAMP-binding protein
MVSPDAVANLLSRSEQEKLRSIATVLNFRRGNTIFSQGEEGHFVYFVDEGMIRVSRCAESGQRQILAFRVPGDFFGLPDGGRYANSAETVSPATLYQISWPQMQQMMLAEPQLQLSLFTKVAHDFRQAQLRIMVLGQQNTYQRLASFLLDLLAVPEFFDRAKSVLKVPVNRFDLADFIGAAPESAARAFAKLESLGCIRRVTSRTIEILDEEGLRSVQHGPRRGNREALPDRSQALLESESA